MIGYGRPLYVIRIYYGQELIAGDLYVFRISNVRLSECGLQSATVIFSEHVRDVFSAAAL